MERKTQLSKFHDYVSMQQASKMLGVHVNTLNNWLVGNKHNLVVRIHPINGRKLFKKSDLEELLVFLEDSKRNGI